MNAKDIKKYQEDTHEIFSNYFLDYLGPNNFLPSSYIFENEELVWTNWVWSSSVEGSILLSEATKLWVLYLHNDTERLFPTYTWEWNGKYNSMLQKILNTVQQRSHTITIDRPFVAYGPIISFGWASRANIELWIMDNRCHTKSRGLYELLKTEKRQPRKRSVTI